MKRYSSATETVAVPIPEPSRPGLGPAWGLLGVIAFSLTVPLTRVAVQTLSPLFVGAGRAVVAGSLALCCLVITRQPLPSARQWLRLTVVAAGVVLGFPLLTSYALTEVPASHGAVVVGVLPAATAVMAVVRGHERPSARFWVAGALGAGAAVGFAVLGPGGLHSGRLADLLLLGAVGLGAVGYAEGGLVSRELGAWQTICWALVLALPVTLVLTMASAATAPPVSSRTGWLCFAYVSAVSMFLGFFAWYRGLAIGPMTRVSQVQLVQPVLSILWSAVLLGEALTARILLGGVTVIGCAAFAVRSRSTDASAKTVA
ncbi:MAG: DMT family transporter [Actinomycetes bacterium]